MKSIRLKKQFLFYQWKMFLFSFCYFFYFTREKFNIINWYQKKKLRIKNVTFFVVQFFFFSLYLK